MPELRSHCESSTRSADPIPIQGDHLFHAIPTTHSDPPEKVAAFRPEWVVAFRRNQWPPSRRNRWSLSPGKRTLRDHLFGRLRERKITAEDLYQLKLWRESEPEAPDGLWYKVRIVQTLWGG